MRLQEERDKDEDEDNEIRQFANAKKVGHQM